MGRPRRVPRRSGRDPRAPRVDPGPPAHVRSEARARGRARGRRALRPVPAGRRRAAHLFPNAPPPRAHVRPRSVTARDAGIAETDLWERVGQLATLIPDLPTARSNRPGDIARLALDLEGALRASHRGGGADAPRPGSALPRRRSGVPRAELNRNPGLPLPSHGALPGVTKGLLTLRRVFPTANGARPHPPSAPPPRAPAADGRPLGLLPHATPTLAPAAVSLMGAKLPSLLRAPADALEARAVPFPPLLAPPFGPPSNRRRVPGVVGLRSDRRALCRARAERRDRGGGDPRPRRRAVCSPLPQRRSARESAGLLPLLSPRRAVGAPPGKFPASSPAPALPPPPPQAAPRGLSDSTRCSSATRSCWTRRRSRRRWRRSGGSCRR